MRDVRDAQARTLREQDAEQAVPLRERAEACALLLRDAGGVEPVDRALRAKDAQRAVLRTDQRAREIDQALQDLRWRALGGDDQRGLVQCLKLGAQGALGRVLLGQCGVLVGEAPILPSDDLEDGPGKGQDAGGGQHAHRGVDCAGGPHVQQREAHPVERDDPGQRNGHAEQAQAPALLRPLISRL